MFTLLFLGTCNPTRAQTKSYKISRISWTITTNAFSTRWSSRIYHSWEAQVQNLETDTNLRDSGYRHWLRAGRPCGRSSSPGGGKNFHFFMSSRPDLGFTQPPFQWVTGTHSPGVKRQGREVDHSPPTSAEVKLNPGWCQMA
jgi:hypothetical protein